jgi:V8-like Glu-specific endopeptidase
MGLPGVTEAKMAKLSGRDIELLSDKLTDTLGFDQLEQYVHASTGDRIYDKYVGRNKPLQPTIRELLIALEQLGTTAYFLHYVHFRRPGRKDIQQLIARLCPDAIAPVPDRDIALSAQTAGETQPDAPTNAIAPGFQRNIRQHLPQLDIRIWLDNLLQIERRVCRIELNDEALGTGFLVGPDTVLTNWHVVEQAKSDDALNRIACRFDYVQLPNGTRQAGQAVPLHTETCLDTSEYSGAETTNTPESPAPTDNELDYALLRLAMPVGQERINGDARGWIVLPNAASPLPKDAPLLIVQHPEGTPMKLAMDTQAVIGRNSNATRILYRTNTERGSSGSPCFTIDWNLVALHHYGDPRWQDPKFNQGVPIELIRRRIEARGFANALGA